AVAIGVAGEVLVAFIFEWKTRHFAELLLATLFGGIVVGGIVVEYVEGSNIATNSQKLREIADKELEKAMKAASDANGISAEADRIAAEANAFVGDALVRAAEADRHAAEANEHAEQEHLERVHIEEMRADRKLSPEQRSMIVEDLKPLPCFSVGLFLMADSVEARNFAEAIEYLFKPLGWRVLRARIADAAVFSPGGVGTGIGIVADPSTAIGPPHLALDPLQSQLIRDFKAAGVTVNPFLSLVVRAVAWPTNHVAYTGADAVEARTAPIRIAIGTHPRGY
ncbi:MAG: hypothetical protein ACRD3J_19515, partial [Thermoanaerobaculia bacterium]